ncbi:MAG: hypothetical protein ACI9JN_001808 [Bacteroidia bacterium]|jgi:hypothetical protein
MKKFCLLVVAFVCTILLGATATEYVKMVKAESVGYSPRYLKGFGWNVYNSPARGVEYDNVLDRTGSYEIAKEDPEWKQIATRDYKGHAQFEFFTKVLVYGISMVGLLLLIVQLRKTRQFNWKHWVSLMISLFFMREVVLALVHVFLFYPCGEGMAWWHKGMNPVLVEKLTIVIGLLLLGFVVYLLPRKYRSRFVGAGALGSIIGLVIWLFWLGPFLFSS